MAEYPEKALQTKILQTYATRSDLRLWRANAGKGLSLDGKRIVAYGVPGQADLSGILPGGIRLEIECKSPTGRQTAEQRAFGAMIARFGGVYLVARSLADVKTALEPYLSGARPSYIV